MALPLKTAALIPAHIAQLVERVLGKNEVSGSNPLVGSNGRGRTAVSLPVQSTHMLQSKRVDLARRESR